MTDFTALNATRVRNWVSPVSFGPHPVTGYSYSLTQDDGSQIPDGNWEFNFAEGFLHCDEGFSAKDLDWKTPLHITAYRYIGGFGAMPQSVPGDYRKTKENLSIIVDPINGKSPPPNTTITQQSEYAALGYSLKYLSDAIAILPNGIGHIVNIRLLPGKHLSNGAKFGNNSNFEIKCLKDSSIYRELDPYGTRSGIYIEADSTNQIESEQAGTLGMDTITGRTSTWVPDAYRGKIVEITSGINAGTKFPILGNDTSTLDLPYFGNIGLCTFIIWEPNVFLMDSTDGALSNSNGGSIRDVEVLVQFKNISFGTPDLPFTTIRMLDHSNLTLESCVVNSSSFIYSEVYDSSTIIQDSYLQIIGGQSGLYMKNGAFVELVNIGISGYATNSLLKMYNRARSKIESVTFMPNQLHVSYCINCEGSLVNFKSSQIKGNGSCSGLKISSDFQSTEVEDLDLKIENCVNTVIFQNCFVSIKDSKSFPNSSSNLNGWTITNGAKIEVSNPETISAINQILIDGSSFSYDQIRYPGDELIGLLGSSIRRI
jgi:hypothetical protein